MTRVVERPGDTLKCINSELMLEQNLKDMSSRDKKILYEVMLPVNIMEKEK